MDRLRGILKQLGALLRKERVERELDEELSFHVAKEAERLAREEGLEPREARRRALVAFGGFEQAKEGVRQGRWTRWLEDVGKDVTYAVRTLRKRPLFTITAVLTLALGIGAVTAVYGVVHAVLVRPLPIEDEERVVMLWKSYPRRDADRRPISLAEFGLWREEAVQLADIAAFNAYGTVPWPWTLESGDRPEMIPTAPVTHGFFTVLGAEARFGRVFGFGDGRSEAPVVVISFGLWSRRFGGDPDVVGRATLSIDGTPLTVIGVMPPDFDYPQGAEIWFPRGGSGANPAYFALGRLRPGATRSSAVAELQPLAERYAADRPDVSGAPTVVARPLRETIVGEMRPALLVLFGAVGLLLLDSRPPACHHLRGTP